MVERDVVGEPLEQPGRHRRRRRRRWRRGWPRGSSRSASPGGRAGRTPAGSRRCAPAPAASSRAVDRRGHGRDAAVRVRARRPAPGRAARSSRGHLHDQPSAPAGQHLAHVDDRLVGEPRRSASRPPSPGDRHQRPRGAAHARPGPAATAGPRRRRPRGRRRTRRPASVSAKRERDLAAARRAASKPRTRQPSWTSATQARSPNVRCCSSVEPAAVLVDVAHREVGDAQRAHVGPQRRQLARGRAVARGGQGRARRRREPSRQRRDQPLQQRGGAVGPGVGTASSAAAVAASDVRRPAAARAARRSGDRRSRTRTATDGDDQEDSTRPATHQRGRPAWRRRSAGSDGTGVRHRVHRRRGDAAARVGRVHDHAVADVHADVADRAVVEHQVAGLQLGLRDRAARSPSAPPEECGRPTPACAQAIIVRPEQSKALGPAAP